MSFDPVSYAMGKKAGGGGGSGVTVEPLTVTENRTYTAPSGKAYSPVTVAVDAIIASGKIIPAQDTSNLTITTGSGEWTHLLLIARNIPYDSDLPRCLGLRYVDKNWGWFSSTFGSSSGSTTPGNCSIYPNDSASPKLVVGESTVSWTGVGSQIGTLVAGVEYDWWCW